MKEEDMKIKVYEDQEKESKEVFLKLVQEDDEVTIMAVDKDGDELTSIAYFSPDGKLYLIEDVDKGLGFKVDDSGQIIVEK
jgi:antitoxin component YwqK of YwqJK toxin-antitoxin module